MPGLALRAVAGPVEVRVGKLLGVLLDRAGKRVYDLHGYAFGSPTPRACLGREDSAGLVISAESSLIRHPTNRTASAGRRARSTGIAQRTRTIPQPQSHSAPVPAHNRAPPAANQFEKSRVRRGRKTRPVTINSYARTPPARACVSSGPPCEVHSTAIGYQRCGPSGPAKMAPSPATIARRP